MFILPYFRLEHTVFLHCIKVNYIFIYLNRKKNYSSLSNGKYHDDNRRRAEAHSLEQSNKVSVVIIMEITGSLFRTVHDTCVS